MAQLLEEHPPAHTPGLNLQVTPALWKMGPSVTTRFHIWVLHDHELWRISWGRMLLVKHKCQMLSIRSSFLDHFFSPSATEVFPCFCLHPRLLLIRWQLPYQAVLVRRSLLPTSPYRSSVPHVLITGGSGAFASSCCLPVRFLWRIVYPSPSEVLDWAACLCYFSFSKCFRNYLFIGDTTWKFFGLKKEDYLV